MNTGTAPNAGLGTVQFKFLRVAGPQHCCHLDGRLWELCGEISDRDLGRLSPVGVLGSGTNAG